jgi:hypothetical protein
MPAAARTLPSKLLLSCGALCVGWQIGHPYARFTQLVFAKTLQCSDATTLDSDLFQGRFPEWIGFNGFTKGKTVFEWRDSVRD